MIVFVVVNDQVLVRTGHVDGYLVIVRVIAVPFCEGRGDPDGWYEKVGKDIDDGGVAIPPPPPVGPFAVVPPLTAPLPFDVCATDGVPRPVALEIVLLMIGMTGTVVGIVVVAVVETDGALVGRDSGGEVVARHFQWHGAISMHP